MKPRYLVTHQIQHVGEVDPWTRAIYETALSHLKRDETEQAIRSLKRALEQTHDFLDAHLWLARLSDDPKTKHKHYSEVIAQVPNHLEATRELMVLKGDLTREEANRSVNSAEPVIKEISETTTKTKTLKCVVCGGHIEANTQGQTICRFCGHVQPIAPQETTDTAPQSLTMAILKRRGQGIQWRIGKRLLSCDNCGAQRLLTQRQFSSRCPFCGSQQVLLRDAVGSFIQPDGIAPFVLTEQEARDRLEKVLKNPVERVAGWFINNKVQSMTLSAVFLPFWFFDVMVNVTRTTSDKRRDSRLALVPRIHTETFGDTVFDLRVSGVESPPITLLNRLERYELRAIVPYHPTHLAGTEAELYTVDYERASLMARPFVGEHFRTRHGHDPHGDKTVTVQTFVQSMQFRLVMVPLWLATLYETDGDVRLGLVHGQSGHVILGRAGKLKL